MNLPCLIGMIFCWPLPPPAEKEFLWARHADEIPSGSSLITQLGKSDVREREKKIVEWFDIGYWPPKQSLFRAVHVYGDGHHLVYYVSADYLRLGNDHDSVLMPLTFTALRELLENWKMLIPTSKMVDQIYQQAERVHWPHAFPPSDLMRSITFLVEHSNWIEERPGWDDLSNPIIAGHKKDLVVSKRLLRPKLSAKLALYGWHNVGNGSAIQPQSLWHGEYYVDYSHGIRLVSPEAELDGKPVSLAKIMRDPSLARLISFEGAYDICAVLRYECD